MTRYSFLILQSLDRMGGADEIRRTLDLVKGFGYDGVELNLTPAAVDWLPRLEGWLADCGLALPSCCTGEAYGKGLCFSSPDPAVRQNAVQRLVDYFDAVRPFGAILVSGLMQGTLADEPDPDLAHGRIVDCLQQVAAAAETRDAVLVVEPVNHLQVGFHNTVAEVRQLVREIGSPAVRPMVDTVHLNIEERSLTGPVLECGAELRHVHVCESNGGLFGTGHVDFAALLNALDEIDYRHWASVKVYRRAALREAAQTSIDHLRRCRDMA